MPVLHQPETLDEVCTLLDTLEAPMVYGGGTAIQILLKQGVLFASDLVDIGRVPGLDTIEETPTGFRVGTMVSLREVELHPGIRQRARLAAATYGKVANPRVRNTASVGGNIAHGDYRLDPPTALLALKGSVNLRSVRGERTVPIREFFTDFQETAVESGELITSIDVPAAPAGSGSAYVKMSALGENDWPAASAAALLDGSNGRPHLRLGLGALGAVPLFVDVDISGLDLDQSVERVLEAAEPLLDPIPDVRGSAEYKRSLGRVATEDAVRRAWEERTV